jgi:hypothetical protein
MLFAKNQRHDQRFVTSMRGKALLRMGKSIFQSLRLLQVQFDLISAGAA